jgi:type II secretory pathway pseudopilin PulG
MKGSTLIETLLYIALLSLLMIGVFSSVYVLIHQSTREEINEEDTNILLKNYYE